MKNLFRDWRGLAGVIALAAVTLQAAPAPAPQVKTLGGGPNQLSPKRSGSANGDTFSVAKFNNPWGLAVNQDGDLLIADRVNNRLRRVTDAGSAGSLTTTFASRLPGPVGVAVDSSNRVYVVTIGDGRLRVFNNDGTLVRTVSGLSRPTALTLDLSNNVFVAEMGGDVKFIASDDSITTVGSGFRKPQGIVRMGNGLLAVSDTGNHAIQSLNPADGSTTLIAGNNGAGYLDGAGATAKFNKPMGISFANGSLVVADQKNHRVRVIGTNGAVRTLYGVKPSRWVQPFPGWVDGDGGGDTGVAAAHDPVGVTVDANGSVFVTEIFWDILRQVTSTGIAGTNGTGNTTNIVVIGTNTVTVVGTNVVSLGFENGEASSDYIGAAGQSFYVPVTLAVAPGQSCYSFQMSLSATGETGVALNPFEAGFQSMLYKPVGGNIYTVITNNYVFTNSSQNVLGLGWLERQDGTILYPANSQDLITYSLARYRLWGKSSGRVVLGGYRMVIPSGALETDTFQVALRNPSGVADGLLTPLPLRIPTEGSLGAGAVNTIKRISLASRPYIVGDSMPFRWYNAGEFGNNQLDNSDVMDVYISAIYSLNTPMEDSDLFNSMDSSDGTLGYDFGDDISIDSVVVGDGFLNVDDVWLTFRRSLDTSRKWFARVWTNGSLAVFEVPNPLVGGFAAGDAVPVKAAARPKSLVRPTAVVTVDDAMPAAGAIVDLPIRVSLNDVYPIRTLMLNITVEPLDGSPAIASPIEYRKSPAFGDPNLTTSTGLGNYSAAWLEAGIPGLSGNANLAVLTVQIPWNAGPNAAYRVRFEHFSASPNGIALFDSHVTHGLLLLSDRSGSYWGDGISDAWKLRYFGSVHSTEAVPNADADADGSINMEEYQNGTNPIDATSY